MDRQRNNEPAKKRLLEEIAKAAREVSKYCFHIITACQIKLLAQESDLGERLAQSRHCRCCATTTGVGEGLVPLKTAGYLRSALNQLARYQTRGDGLRCATHIPWRAAPINKIILN